MFWAMFIPGSSHDFKNSCIKHEFKNSCIKTFRTRTHHRHLSNLHRHHNPRTNECRKSSAPQVELVSKRGVTGTAWSASVFHRIGVGKITTGLLWPELASCRAVPGAAASMRRRMRRQLRAGRYVRKVIMRLRRAAVLDADALQRLPHELDVVNAMMVRHYVLGRVFDTNEYWESLQRAWEDP